MATKLGTASHAKDAHADVKITATALLRIAEISERLVEARRELTRTRLSALRDIWDKDQSEVLYETEFLAARAEAWVGKALAACEGFSAEAHRLSNAVVVLEQAEKDAALLRPYDESEFVQRAEVLRKTLQEYRKDAVFRYFSSREHGRKSFWPFSKVDKYVARRFGYAVMISEQASAVQELEELPSKSAAASEAHRRIETRVKDTLKHMISRANMALGDAVNAFTKTRPEMTNAMHEADAVDAALTVSLARETAAAAIRGEGRHKSFGHHDEMVRGVAIIEGEFADAITEMKSLIGSGHELASAERMMLDRANVATTKKYQSIEL